jgi:predicted NodU family carbamoyl transferase
VPTSISVLGISALYHDSAACLVTDGEIVAASQEERFTRKRHDAALPFRAIDDCLGQAGITAADVDYVVFYTADGMKGTAIVQGIGSYRGTLEKQFDITPCNIGSCKGIQVTAMSYAEVAGGQAKQHFAFKSPAGTDLVEGTDYEVVYSDDYLGQMLEYGRKYGTL